MDFETQRLSFSVVALRYDQMFADHRANKSPSGRAAFREAWPIELRRAGWTGAEFEQALYADLRREVAARRIARGQAL